MQQLGGWGEVALWGSFKELGLAGAQSRRLGDDGVRQRKQRLRDRNSQKQR